MKPNLNLFKLIALCMIAVPATSHAINAGSASCQSEAIKAPQHQGVSDLYQEIRIIGDDTREDLEAKDKSDFEGVGLIYMKAINPETGKHYSGNTAMLVGDCRTVVTAAHNFVDGNSGEIITKDLYYSYNGQPAKLFKIDESSIKVPQLRNLHGSNRQHDRAILKLEKPVPNCKPLDFVELPDNVWRDLQDRIHLVAFHGDSGERKIVRKCSDITQKVERSVRQVFSGIEDQIFFEDCDSVAGASGGGYFVYYKGKPYLIGMQLGLIDPQVGSIKEEDRFDHPNYGLKLKGSFYEEIEQALSGS